MVRNIYIDNQNFIESVTALRTKAFGDKTTYIFLYDNLRKEFKKYLDDNDLPKNLIEIQLTKNKNINKDFLNRYRHQIIYLKHETIKLQKVLDDIFMGIANKKELLAQLSEFQPRQILSWLESSAMMRPKLAKELSPLEKYVYSPFFYSVILYNFYGTKFKAVWMKK